MRYFEIGRKGLSRSGTRTITETVTAANALALAIEEEVLLRHGGGSLFFRSVGS